MAVASTGMRMSQRLAFSPSIGASSNALTSSGRLEAMSLARPRTSSGRRPTYPPPLRPSARDRASQGSFGTVADRAYISSGVQTSSAIEFEIGRFGGSGDGDQAAEIDSKMTASDHGFDAPFGDDQRLDWIVGTLLAAKVHIHVKTPGQSSSSRAASIASWSPDGAAVDVAAPDGDGTDVAETTRTRRCTRGLGGRRRGCGGARTWLMQAPPRKRRRRGRAMPGRWPRSIA